LLLLSGVGIESLLMKEPRRLLAANGCDECEALHISRECEAMRWARYRLGAGSGTAIERHLRPTKSRKSEMKSAYQDQGVLQSE
jgi:hypothetical protein